MICEICEKKIREDEEVWAICSNVEDYRKNWKDEIWAHKRCLLFAFGLAVKELRDRQEEETK